MPKKDDGDFESVVLHLHKDEMEELRRLSKLGYGKEPVHVVYHLLKRELDDLKRCRVLRNGS